MKAKNIIFSLLAIVSLMAFQTASDNNTYHVMATSGLKMRAKPNGKKLLTIPYNGAVEKINDGKSYGKLTVTELKNFKIKGEWIKVRYEGQEGFVFDGFLTQFPMPDLNSKMNWEQYNSKFEAHLDKHFTQKEEKFDIKTFDGEEPFTCAYSLKYEEGHFYRYENCKETSSQYDIEIEGITLIEAYFLIKAFDLNDSKKAKEQDKAQYEYDTRTKTIKEEPRGAGCWISAKQGKLNSVVFDMGCGC